MQNALQDKGLARACTGPHVTILMGVYNGAAALESQLQSIATQTHTAWDLVISDDGSTDTSRQICDRFARDLAAGRTGGVFRQVRWVEGPRAGFARNYLSLLCQPIAQDHFIAFCDQDDVWLPDRLSRGLAALESSDNEFGNGPALYCSRTWITDATLTTRRLSAPRPKPPGFRNALVQNIASGNTILLNPVAARIVTCAAQKVSQVVAHDWWVYQLISGAGGRIVHDNRPTLLYRQHAGNQIGANDDWRARLHRLHRLMVGDFKDWNEINIAALQSCESDLTPENRALLQEFATLRQASIPDRLRRLQRARLYRQSRGSTAMLWLAAALARI